jgi:signal transduction histidine kinase
MLDSIYGELTPGQEDGLNRIRASARHLLELISDILDLARIEAGKMPIHLSDVTLPDVLGEVGRQIEPLVRKKGLSFDSNVVGEPPLMYTDGIKVRQILLNLLSNAVKFTQTGRVMLTSTTRSDCVLFEVTDTGIGIRAQDLASIWEDFRQLDQSRTREFGGTGLGLSITRRLVQQLGGRIDVRSQFGLGTTFTVALPFRVSAPPETDDGATSGNYLAVDSRWDQHPAGSR